MNAGVNKKKVKIVPEYISVNKPIIMKENNAELSQNLDGVYLTPNYYAIFIQSDWDVIQGLFVLATEH